MASGGRVLLFRLTFAFTLEGSIKVVQPQNRLLQSDDHEMLQVNRWLQTRLEKSRSKNFYTKYLEKCEEHISQAEDRRSDTLLMQSFADDPPPSIGSQVA